MKLIALILVSILPASAVNLTSVAAGTTIAVNLLEIKTNIQRTRKAVKAVKKASASAVRKLAKQVK